jgi:hypothetical protein
VTRILGITVPTIDMQKEGGLIMKEALMQEFAKRQAFNAMRDILAILTINLVIKNKMKDFGKSGRTKRVMERYNKLSESRTMSIEQIDEIFSKMNHYYIGIALGDDDGAGGCKPVDHSATCEALISIWKRE